MGWKPGDPPRRRLRAVPSPPAEEDKPVSPPAIRRRRRQPVDDSSPSETVTAGGSGVPGGTRGTGSARRNQKLIRLGNRWSEIVQAVKDGEYSWADFVASLDDDEVARCQLKASDGTFTGRPPAIVPREFALAAARELQRRFEAIFKDEVLGIAEAYVKLAQDTDIPAEKRLKAMQYAMERIFGAIPKEVRVSQEAPWETVVTSIVAEDGQEVPAVDRYAGREGDGLDAE
jgi:hypothetical protein